MLPALLMMTVAPMAPVSAAPILVVTERVHEMAVLSYRVDATHRGFAILDQCRGCDERTRWPITPDTRLIVDGRTRSFADLRRVDRRRAMIFYDPESRHLNRIVLTGAAFEE